MGLFQDQLIADLLVDLQVPTGAKVDLGGLQVEIVHHGVDKLEGHLHAYRCDQEAEGHCVTLCGLLPWQARAVQQSRRRQRPSPRSREQYLQLVRDGAVESSALSLLSIFFFPFLLSILLVLEYKEAATG